MEAVLKLVIIAILLYLFFTLVFLPFHIARNRGIDKGQTSVICILCFLSFVLPIIWVVAIIMSVVCKPVVAVVEEEKEKDLDVDKLAKLHELYKDKVITKAEYDKQKKKIMGG